MNDDGRLDLMVHGLWGNSDPYVTFHINLGSNNWLSRQGLRCSDSFASVGDFDNDNRPDIFWTGAQSTPPPSPGQGDLSHISYGVASNQLNQLDLALQVFPFYAAFGRSLVLDFDHDGRQDILLPDGMSPDYTTFTNAPDPLVGAGPRLMRNEFPGTRGYFKNSYFRLMPTTPRSGDPTVFTEHGFISSGDLDGDGFPDVYNYGFRDPDTFQSRGWEILRNDGEMGLAVTQQGNRALGSASFTASCNAWADFNGDGLDDLVVAEGGSYYYYGSTAPGQILVLLNDGQGHLTNSGSPLMSTGWSDLAVGDIFNHGRNDIIFFTVDSALGSSQILIFRNEGNGVFTKLDYGFYNPADYFPSAQGQGIRLADYDRDGRLDFCQFAAHYSPGADMFGADSDTTVLYRNELDIPSNAPPQAPAGLSTVVGPGTVTFKWGSATDDITPTSLLTYNLRVGTNSLGTSVVSPLANVTNGWRKIAEPGNCRHTFSALYRFPPGTYYWSVQAVDGAFAGGAWATEQTFTITAPEQPLLSAAKQTNGTLVSWPARFTDFQLESKNTLSITNWTSNSIPTVLANGKATITDTNATGSRFFRLRK